MEFSAFSWAACSVLLLLTQGADLGWAASWTYEGDKGPLYWHELFPQACSGKYQSPIDIKTEETMYNSNLRDFAIWYDPPLPGSAMTVLNNGHTVQVVTSGEFYVTNGGLTNVYKTAQFHFHWGHAKHHGSEHLIDGHAYPLELHIVNYNKDLYEDIGQAVTQKMGLAVLGVMFVVSEEDNEDLEPVIAAMEQVQDPGGNQVEIEPLSIRKLLPKDITQYFRYNGSLTTPGCFESVVWTVFAQPQHISKRQMAKFRGQLQMRHRSGGHHKRSVRDPMPINRSGRRRERRALQVLDELALTPEQKQRFRRELVETKEHAEMMAAKMDEENAGETHRRTLEAVHKSADDHNHGDDDHDDDDDDDEHISEVEIEYLQEKMVNNFRPVQPLNDRIVYRSFKLGDSGHNSHHHHHHNSHSSGDSDLPDKETLRERLKLYASTTGAGASNVFSLLLLLVSCLAALFL